MQSVRKLHVKIFRLKPDKLATDLLDEPDD